MLFLRRFLKDEKLESAAAAVYTVVAQQARHPAFYLSYEVPDTVDGRFEMVVLQAYILFRRLKGQGEAIDRLTQAIYDVMFKELDLALREMGAADLGVGRRIKHMAESMNGRIQFYDQGLAANDDDASLTAALQRNLYGTVDPSATSLERMIRYLKLAISTLESQQTDRIVAADFHFVDPAAI
ncbi:ubiquinol-cytochrome C chaperone family protein [Dongia soli]|uniref:Ubiquinol-cytochrome C chaperone family protein n=1 Tax=Dongia soli TaxID=600628 RepID=A0ABU5EAZ0_9PROT|nr:ubiquinol-cytochrome C chaperone family protein [Dongia soli]MDY0883219.1 ubiquinol-cytochrome C chaperone family protein [Dongia soli]